MAARTDYQIVGRYMSGREVTGYHLQSIESGKSGKYSRDAIAYLVGKEQISNCSGQIYKDKVILRGKGMSLDDLPTQNEDGTMKNTEHLGRVPKNATTADTMNMFMIVGVLRAGRNVVGYVIQNAGCGIKKVKRQQVLELAQQGKIGNARVQMYNGKPLLRGYGCNLDELPVENIGKPEEPVSNNGTLTKTKEAIKIKDRMNIKAGLNKLKSDYKNSVTNEMKSMISDVKAEVTDKAGVMSGTFGFVLKNNWTAWVNIVLTMNENEVESKIDIQPIGVGGVSQEYTGKGVPDLKDVIRKVIRITRKVSE